MRLELFLKSEPGTSLFGQNDDRLFSDAEARLFAVADASGPTYGGFHKPTGPGPGWQAMLVAWRENAALPIDDRLRRALVAANEAMLDPGWEERVAAMLAIRRDDSSERESSAGDGRLTHPTASFTVAGLDDDRLALAQVGSCRGYRIHQGVVERLLPDHSLATQATLPGADPALLALLQFHRTVCTRLLGLRPAVEVDLRVVPVCAGDDFLLCTDGVWLPLDDATIAEAFAEAPADGDAILSELLRLARETDGFDHRSCLILRAN
ncbi:MAG: hypothetical protein CVU65_13960 [Deltaproteobacteria bacterium HGW-Deltaproteobacteria-22]|nr:MAG: hypothetical protein CVU65_13960 [Deltaproteobacteria bacterium HGW-Deltaproteobacteria-22]